MLSIRLTRLAFVGCILPVAAVAAPAPIYSNVVTTTADPLLANLAIPANAATAGMWSTTYNWPLVGLHLSVTPDGRVLSFGTPDGQGVQDGRTLDLWSPALGFAPASHVQIANSQPVDSFCGTAAILPGSGATLISGGGSLGDGYQSYSSTLVGSAQVSAVNANFALAGQRWYATMITLPDGRPLIGGGGAPYAIVGAFNDPAGNANAISSTPEIFTPSSGWSTLPNATSEDAFGATNNRAWYPRMWVAPNGTVFGISTDKMWNLDPNRGTITTVGNFKTTVNNNTLPNVGPTSTAVMYDVGKVIQVGGNGYNNGYASNSSPYATTVDISNPAAPVMKETSAMHYARQWPNSLVLPNGNVLVTGGSTYADNAGSNAVYAAEIWNPSTGRWTVGASAANYRGYHSATALLPDGVVLSSGGGVPGPVTNLNAELYYPPYLFTKTGNGAALATRPQIVSFSATTANYGGTLNVQMADAGAIRQATLIGLSAVTHSFNTFQRRVPVTLNQNGAVITVTMPGSANIAPPGYYLLTMNNAAGVFSSSVIIGLNAAPVPQSNVTALLPVDGAVRSIESIAQPGNVIRHANFVAYLNAISPQSDTLSRSDASFYTRAGNADQTCYSFESVNYPGYFLRHQNFQLFLQAKDGSALFNSDSTFCATAGLSGYGFSLRPSNYPDHYVDVRGNGTIGIDVPDGSTAFNQASSFTFTEQFLPVDGKLHSIAQLGLPFSLIRHQNYVGYVASINTASLALDRSDSSFFIRAGNGNNACYSFEAKAFPNYFLRATNGTIALNQSDNSSGFNNDSTFCLQTGLAGYGFTLAQLANPASVIHVQPDDSLAVGASDGTPGFAAAASFSLSPAPTIPGDN